MTPPKSRSWRACQPAQKAISSPVTRRGMTWGRKQKAGGDESPRRYALWELSEFSHLSRTRVALVGLPILLCCLASICNSFHAVYLVIALIMPALAMMLVNLHLITNDWEDAKKAMDFQDKWRKQRDRLR